MFRAVKILITFCFVTILCGCTSSGQISKCAMFGAIGCGISGVSNVQQPRQRGFYEISMDSAQIHAKLTSVALTKDSPEKVMQAIQDLVRYDMKDPDATKFRNVRLVNYLDGKVVCGEYNGKNSYGAYVGFKRFYGSPDDYETLSTDSSSSVIDDQKNAGLYAACGKN